MSHRSNVFARFREKAVANFRINQLASLCHQVAALVQDVFSNFYVMKDDKIATTQHLLKLVNISTSL